MLKAGDTAPDFEKADCRGRSVKLSAYRGKKVVLFFFPRAFTAGCTEEIRHFRDNQSRIEGLNAVLIGVSVDKYETQCEFAKAESIDFPLLGDETRVISESYGVVWPIYRRDRRATFVIDEAGVIVEVIHHETKVYRHLDDVLATLTRAALPASAVSS
jgi:peroxiredoxin Q/BCP